MNKIKLIICALFVCTSISVKAQEQQDVIIQDAWVAALPPSQTVTAAYLTVDNLSNEEIVLVSASTPVAGITEMHRMSHENGMMKMGMLKNVKIPAGAHLKFEPGANHLMLINLKKPVLAGDSIPITLNFKSGKSITVNAQARVEPAE